MSIQYFIFSQMARPTHNIDHWFPIGVDIRGSVVLLQNVNYVKLK